MCSMNSKVYQPDFKAPVTAIKFVLKFFLDAKKNRKTLGHVLFSFLFFGVIYCRADIRYLVLITVCHLLTQLYPNHRNFFPVYSRLFLSKDETKRHLFRLFIILYSLFKLHVFNTK